MVEWTSRDRPKPIKLFCGLIGTAEATAQARDLVAADFGEIDLRSAAVPFVFTGYYSQEMGENLIREWVAFRELRARGYPAIAKHLAVRVEAALAREGKRTVNIDPGYVDDAQVVLTTGKNYSHRLYIGMGYYAEVTLVYDHKVFKPLAWTYPDYRTEEALRFFDDARRAYLSCARRLAIEGLAGDER
jgi:hypothetical protein